MNEHLEVLRAALRPFADVANCGYFNNQADSYAPRPSHGRPNLADYRRAAAVLAKLEGAEDENSPCENPYPLRNAAAAALTP